MKVFSMFCILTTLTTAHSHIQWPVLLERYRSAMGEPTYQLLSQQQQAYATGQAPVIADPCIKQIPIHECDEELVDVYASNSARIRVMIGDELLKAHEQPEDIDPRSEKHGMMRRSVFNALIKMITELDILAPAFGYEAGELEIRLFEGLRDLATQKQLFDGKMAALLQANPTMTAEEAYAETTKWVSPYINNVPVHSTGAAIDIHLWNNKTHTFCDMGRFNKGGALAPTFSEDPRLTDQQKLNRLLFLIAATRAGLTNYVYEFWHFSLGDRYAAYWREADATKRIALYGPA